MTDDFVIARNPDQQSTLPYLIRLPLGPAGVVLKARETWPRTSKVYCHASDGWPEDAELVERVPVRSCVRRGAAIDLVLDRGRESRSQIIFTRVRGGREAIFWQSARTTKQARPNVNLPTARAAGRAELHVLVDVHEHYAWRFSRQQVTTSQRPLAVGDYAVEHEGQVLASVERKSLDDLVGSLTSGRLRYALAELASLPLAAVVVEDRYSRLFSLERVRPALLADGMAECQARWPSVPIMFCETRALAQEWTYRFLAAALAEASQESRAVSRLAGLAPAGVLQPRPPTTAEVRAWALDNGYAVSRRGRLRPEVRAAWQRVHEP